jgi:hypothetical protein
MTTSFTSAVQGSLQEDFGARFLYLGRNFAPTRVRSVAKGESGSESGSRDSKAFHKCFILLRKCCCFNLEARSCTAQTRFHASVS